VRDPDRPDASWAVLLLAEAGATVLRREALRPPDAGAVSAHKKRDKR
jgi:hypothetical protein